MKWGVRRWQNKDGTLTEDGKKRYLKPDNTLTKLWALTNYFPRFSNRGGGN